MQDRSVSPQTAKTVAPASVAAAEPILLCEDIAGTVVLTLNRPEVRNTLSEAMLAALCDAFSSIARDDRVHAVVLAAKGPVFCAGHDLKELNSRRSDPDRGRAYLKNVMTTCSAMMQQIVKLPHPVIAAVQATATAAGCQLVASCDLAVASRTAKFATSGIDVGLFCSTPMVALSRNVSRKHAMEMLVTGEMITADHAQRIGLVNRVVEPGEEREEALRLASIIGGKSSVAIKLGKAAFYRQLELPLSEAYELASDVMVENMLTHDAEEGISAFIEKRKPNRKGR
jgi:enoyl-CoA hydratase/carnithine racemase